MSTIAFLGLGNMGRPMALNLARAGHAVLGWDVTASAMQAFAAAGGTLATDLPSALLAADTVVTMLPAGAHVRSAYLGEGGIIAATARQGALLIDCSTIDVQTARDVAAAAGGRHMVDAPVSGGVGGATAGTLTFMVGGGDAAFARAEPLLQAMGRTIMPARPAPGRPRRFATTWCWAFRCSRYPKPLCWLTALVWPGRSCSTSPASPPASAGR